jgi:outer membrane protein TolC
MKKSLILAAATALALPAVTAAVENITLDEYLGRVKSSHPLFKAEQLEPAIQRRDSESYLGDQNWRLVADGAYSHVEPLQTSPFDPERVDVLEAGAGTDRLFWGSGSRLSLDWYTSVTDQNLPGFSIPGPGGPVEIPIGPSTYYRNVLSATWSLPLMQNRGGELDRLQYEMSVYDVDASAVNAWEAQEDFLLEAGSKFLLWVLAEERLDIARRRLDLAREEFDRSKRKRQAFLVDEVDVWRAEAAVYNTESALNLIESQRKSVQADLATLAGDSVIYSARPQYDLYDLPAPPEVDAFVDDIVRNSRLVLALAMQRDKLRRLERGYSDTKRPSLDLNVRGALQGGDDGFGGAFEMKYPDLGVGLVFSYPIGNETAKANLDATRLRIRQLEERIGSVRVSLSASARSIIVRMEELRAVIESNLSAISANEKRTEEELKLYNQGRGDLAFVIQSRDNIALSELEYAGNVASYHNLLLQLEALSDSLLPTPADELDVPASTE